MDLELSSKDLAFQKEVRAFLEKELTSEMRAANARHAGVFAEGDMAKRWHEALYRRGWVAPFWPKEFGGPGWTVVERYIFDAELAGAGAPSLPAMGIRMLGPVLMRFGTEEQKREHLPKILSGENFWCQGYSEPQAGSDLAGLQCRAERRGDAYVINGTKIWTTHAQFANWIFCLVRTRTDGKPQQGITFILVPMSAKGISVRPIITLAGDHEVNQVFFDDVSVPAANRVSEENDGWSVAKYLLEFERGGGFAPRLKSSLRKLKRVAAEAGLASDPAFRQRCLELEIRSEAIDMSERRIISEMSKGGSPGDAAASVLKLQGTETLQLIDELAVEALGVFANVDQRPARYGNGNFSVGPESGIAPVGRYLNNRASTIYGGSSEVQRNILAKVALGL